MTYGYPAMNHNWAQSLKQIVEFIHINNYTHIDYILTITYLRFTTCYEQIVILPSFLFLFEGYSPVYHQYM